MISRQEAAELLDCSAQTVANWVERGLLKGHTIGRALMVDRDSIEQYFDDLKEMGAMAQQIADMKKEYQTLIRENRDILSEARGAFVASLDAREVFRANQLLLLNLCKGYLKEREFIIFSGFINGKKPEELGKALGLTRVRVCQIALKAAEKLSYIEELLQIRDKNVALETENERLRQKISRCNDRLKEYENINKLAFTLFAKRLDEFNLSVRTLNGLRSKNCHTIADLVKIDRAELMKARNFGKKSVCEVDELICKLGLSWGMDLDSMSTEELKKWSE